MTPSKIHRRGEAHNLFIMLSVVLVVLIVANVAFLAHSRKEIDKMWDEIISVYDDSIKSLGVAREEAERIHDLTAKIVSEQNEPPASVEDRELLIPCGLTARQLEGALRNGLKPYATAFISAEKETGVNALFLAAVAALESGWGESDIAKDKNNLFGWTDETGEYMRFDNPEHCIICVSVRIAFGYLHPDGPCFNGYTVEDVGEQYNPGNPEWAEKTRDIMLDIEWRAAGL